MTQDRAERLMREAEAAFGAADINRILAMFTDDVLVRYADLPEMRGLDAYAEFLRSRFARQRNYQARKSLRAVTGDLVIDSWDGAWVDAVTGSPMRGRGIEILAMRDGKVARLDAVVNTWHEDNR